MLGNSSRRRLGILAVASATAATVAVVAIQPAATAHQSGWRADNTSHVWCFGDSTEGKPAVREAMEYSMNNLDGQTQMSEVGPGGCDSLTDVQFAEGFVGNGVRGEWRCISFNNNGVCFKSRVTLNKDIIDRDDGPYELNLKKTACHEVGHSVGLDHHPRPGDCMVTDAVLEGHIFYIDVHINAINSLHD